MELRITHIAWAKVRNNVTISGPKGPQKYRF
mgnify:CR=1 FL=1